MRILSNGKIPQGFFVHEGRIYRGIITSCGLKWHARVRYKNKVFKDIFKTRTDALGYLLKLNAEYRDKWFSICPVCNKEFPVWHTGKYCSKECYAKANGRSPRLFFGELPNFFQEGLKRSKFNP